MPRDAIALLPSSGAVHVAWFLPLLLFACATETAGRPAGDRAAGPAPVRIATFNVAMGLDQEGALSHALQRDDDPRLHRLAAILQHLRPDVVLLNEFDYDAAVDAAGLLNANYLAHARFGQAPIRYGHAFRAPVNTGVPSGLDLDRDGVVGGPGDAWGFGRFPGQYGMLVLSRLPIDQAASRTFQRFRWSELPGARRPVNPDGTDVYSDQAWEQLRLSSKSHWDVVIDVRGRPLHLLASHPTPPVFDGPEDRNGLRNFDEIRFWAEYISGDAAGFLRDDSGRAGGLPAGADFVIAGDLNADPLDGDSVPGAIGQLLAHPRVDAGCVPLSAGGRAATHAEGGANTSHRGDPSADTSNFDDAVVGNLRLDYLLPSRGLPVAGCGVFWPEPGEPGAGWATVSDHRLVWLDVSW